MTDIQFQIIKEVKIILEISAPSNFGCSCRKSTTRFYKLLINSCFVPVIFDRKYYGEHVRFEVSYRAYFVPYAVKSLHDDLQTKSPNLLLGRLYKILNLIHIQ